MRAPISQRITEFNALAHTHNWPVSCDPELMFEAPELSDIYTVWRNLAADGNIPRRDQIKPRLIKPYLGNIAIIERVAELPSRYFVRLMGSRLALTLGEMQGQLLDQVLTPEICSRWTADADLTLAELRPLRFYGDRLEHRQLTFLRAEALLAPLAGPRGCADQVLVAMIIKRSTCRPS